MIVLDLLALYAATGLAFAGFFVTAGIARVAPGSAMSIGARLLAIPGATILWPYVALRWFRAGRNIRHAA